MDIVEDTLENERKIRTLNILHDFNREALAMEVSFFSLTDLPIVSDGFSYYEIQSKGSISLTLLKAYQKMNELNGDVPRKNTVRNINKNCLDIEFK